MCVFALALGTGSSAGAQVPPPADVQAAQGYFQRGLTLFDRGDFDAALVEFERAYDLSRRPVVLFNIAASHQGRHRYPEAIAALERYLAVAPPEAPQREQARRGLDELRLLVARLRVQTEPPTARVSFDGSPPVASGALVLLRPGTHTYAATSDGFADERGSLSVLAGEERTLSLRLTPAGEAPPPPPPPVRAQPASGLHPRWFVIAAVSTGALTVGAAATGVATALTWGDFSTRTPDDPAVNDLSHRGRALAISTDVLGSLAVAGAITSVVLLTRTRFGTPARASSLAPLVWAF